MKNYYYFLGVSQDATDEEIRHAYRKLSLKYHPDKNPDDEFFENRFREVQEAYEMLISKEKREVYDNNFSTEKYSGRTLNPPKIVNFTSNKIRAVKGEEIIVRWETQNADVVKILPFGLMPKSGEKTFKITEFQRGQFNIVLQAHNSAIQKSEVLGITISEIFARENDDSTKNYNATPKPQVQPKVIANNYRRIFAGIIILIFLVFFIWKMLFGK